MVQKILFFKERLDKKVFTICRWSEDTSCIIPEVDFLLLTKVKFNNHSIHFEEGLISYSTYISKFGEYLEPFAFGNCKIIHPQNLEKSLSMFKEVRFEQGLKSFASSLPLDQLVNTKPSL
ncbi:hypothetical protein MM239_13485 [Belliella sp. DSM 111904]|uniref:Uncharacterized protein n=1 Tax=Belliella filtrata TaxID=2923435 RepID=A0ABS9V1W5_9BACT|nr:hypothetical protein [Belliella filtrata]MCH7410414.1 hypothetical protein [Belliella filtrata]